jgi:hypothetical protein
VHVDKTAKAIAKAQDVASKVDAGSPFSFVRRTLMAFEATANADKATGDMENVCCTRSMMPSARLRPRIANSVYLTIVHPVDLCMANSNKRHVYYKGGVQ